MYVPQFLRILCLSGYLTREEKEAFGHDEEMLKRLSGNRELMMHMTKKPGKFGHIVKDSFFSDHCEEAEENPEVLGPDPNLGFGVKEEILAHVYKRDNISIDHSP